MNPPPPASFYSVQPYGARPGPPPTPQPYPPPAHAGHMRPPPLDTSFMHNGSHMQQQYPNNNSTAYPTPALTSRPQSMYQTPPSSDGNNSSNNKDYRARRISVTTGDNGWKVSGRSSGAPSQYQPNGYEHPGNSFNDRRMRRQSMGSAIAEHPITPAYTPRDSHYGYFSPTHATMSPQEHVAPGMPPQPISKRESFVGGFVIPPAYPPYRPAQAPPETPYQYPQTSHHQSASQYPQTPHHPPAPQPQYPQTPHRQSAPQPQYPQTPHRQSAPQPYPQTQHHHSAPQHRNSYYAYNDSYHHNNYAVTAAEDVSPASATAEHLPASSADNPPAGRARSVKSVRSVKSNKSLKSLNGASGETKQTPPKKRQITVRSVNEHLVWIDIAPNETGAGIAEKIQTIATYKTKKVLSITTASGKKIALNRRPLFDDWANVHEIQHGEEWTIEWGDLDRGMMDRIFSKVVQVGEGRPSNADESQQ